MIKHILAGLFFVAITWSVFAQQNVVSWEQNYDHFGIENGLPSSETYQVYQDKSGLLWVLTDRGVVRYDGFEFHKYTTENGLSDNINFRIVEDENGGVWFVGYNGLLSVFKNGKMQAYKYNHVLQKSIPVGRNTNVSLHVNKDNSIVYCVFRKNIFTVSKDGKVKELLNGFKETGYFFEFGNNVLCVQQKSTSIAAVRTYLFRNNKRFFSGNLYFSGTTRAKKHKGSCFVMTEMKLYESSGNRFKLLLDGEQIISLDCDEEFVYVGIYKSGLKKYRFNPKTKELILVQRYLPNYSVSSAYTDSNGTLWLTTLEKGLFCVYDEAFKQLAINGKLLSEEVRFINGNREKIILTHYVGKWQQLYPPFLCKDIGKIVYKYNLVPIKEKFAFEKNIVDWSDWKDVDDRYIANPIYSTDSSVVGNGRRSGKITEMKSGSNTFYDLESVRDRNFLGSYLWFYFASDKKAYILFDEGVYLFLIKNSKITNDFKFILKERLNQIKYNKVWDLVAFSSSEGLYQINTKKDTYSRIAPDLNLGKQILAIFFDEKNQLWVVTEKGVYVLVKKNGKAKLRFFLNKKSLSSSEITDLYVYNDMLYLTTKFGVQKIDFTNIKKISKRCPIQVFSIQAFSMNKELPRNKIYSSGTDLIKISLFNRNLEKQQLYRYRFGKDQTWIKSNKGEIIINNPGYGEYNLELSCLNAQNDWTKSTVLASFTVEKIIFLRWYFILMYVCITCGIFYIVLKYTIRSVNRKNDLLNRMVELERMALAAQMNPHFIFNSLNSIHSFLLYEENESAEKYLLRFARLIRQTLANSRVPYITIKEEYETLKNYILLENMRFKNKFDFEIECDFNQLPLNPCVPPMLIQPYVENAILHGLVKRSIGGKLVLKFYLEEGLLKVSIEDNGIGYAESKKDKTDSKHKSYGTQITEERLKSFQNKNKEGYRVSITHANETDSEFPGTRVTLTIPIPDSSEK